MGTCYMLGTVVFYIHYLIVILLKTLQSTHYYSYLVEKGSLRQLNALSKIFQLLRSRATISPHVC